jgi:hypothetical protein
MEKAGLRSCLFFVLVGDYGEPAAGIIERCSWIEFSELSEFGELMELRKAGPRCWVQAVGGGRQDAED